MDDARRHPSQHVGTSDTSRQRITFGRFRSEANIHYGGQEQSDHSNQTKQFCAASVLPAATRSQAPTSLFMSDVRPAFVSAGGQRAERSDLCKSAHHGLAKPFSRRIRIALFRPFA
jgi:hypothetical protein